MLRHIRNNIRRSWVLPAALLVPLVTVLLLHWSTHSEDSQPPRAILTADGPDRFSDIRMVSHDKPVEDSTTPGATSTKRSASRNVRAGTEPKRTVRQTVTLWNATPGEFESHLLETLDGRLAVRRGDDGSREYALSLSGDNRSGDRGPRLLVNSTENRVRIEGNEEAVRGVSQLIHALDRPRSAKGIGVRCVSTSRSQSDEIGRLIRAVRLNRESRIAAPTPQAKTDADRPFQVAMQSGEQNTGPQPEPTHPESLRPEPANSGAEPPAGSPARPPVRPPVRPRANVPAGGPVGVPYGAAPAAPRNRPSNPSPTGRPTPTPTNENIQPSAAEPAAEVPAEGGPLVGPVQVQVLEGMDALIIRGRPEDVKRVADLVRQIETYGEAIVPATDVVLLRYADATALGTLLDQLYEEVLSAREGTVSITALAAPNGLLLIGRPESVEKLKDLVAKLDIPVAPATRFQVFRLKTVPATEAEENITSFFEQEDDADDTAMVARVHVVADFRSNSLIVRASPNDMAEVAAIIARIDSGDSDAFNEVRVFKLKNASAETLAPILQDAVTGQMYGQRARTGPSMAGGMGRAEDYEKKSTRLKLITIDAKGRAVLNSGILTDAQVTADPRTNSLVVTASADSMPLIAALIGQLDSPPSIEAQVKVFTLVNGDATNMAEMLENIFGAAVAGDEIAVRTGVVPEETSLVGLNFAVDVRTNSIIVTGSAGALTVVEAVLARLDGSDPRERKTAVYRIKNIQAEDVATAINEYLTTKRDIETANADVLSVFEQIDREVIVVAEPASNSIIISATPRYFADITRLVEEIDRRQPMIMIQVVIAEVSLDDFSEFGVELGLEDSVLFNRSLATGGLAVPGSLFSNGRDTGGRGVTSFGTGQVNTDLSFGGLVLNASSESVSVLVRALQSCSKMKVLSRPQIMTLDNEPAQIVVGEDVPFITGTSFSEFGQQNSIDYREVGLILTVTPRVSADGLVVMEIVATNSKVGPVDEGIPVSVADGEVIRSPRIEMISAQTVVSSMNGQTVVMGGLIIEDDRIVCRRVPWLSSVPVVGNLFKYESKTKERTELLIIMTPRIVENAGDADRIAQVEASRLHWCRRDVQCMHGGYGGDPFFACPAQAGGPAVIYPDETPTFEMMPEMMPQMPGAPCDTSQGTQYISIPHESPVEPGMLLNRGQSEVIPAPPGLPTPALPTAAQPPRNEPPLKPVPATPPQPSYPVMPKLGTPTASPSDVRALPPTGPESGDPAGDQSGAALPEKKRRRILPAGWTTFGQRTSTTTDRREDR